MAKDRDADYDEELAALLTLDALEPDEQADAELRLGTFAMDDAVVALARLVAEEPPDDLRGSTLAAAATRRRPGRPTDRAGRCSPDVAFERTVEDLHELLVSLSDDEWNAHAHTDHGRVHDLMAHLLGVEQLMLRWLDPNDDVPFMPDHLESTREVVDELADIDPRRIARDWYDAAREVLEVGRQDLSKIISFHDLTMSVDAMFTVRTFELWAHGMDIAVATGRPLSTLDAQRMALMSSGVMASLPYALAYRQKSAPGRTAHIVMTGPSGGTFTVPLAAGQPVGEPDVTIVVDTIDLCMVAARRLDPAELRVTVEGDPALADLVFAGIDAFARD
jgi:uncharacterized protein (TIGR03083 family)